MSVIIVSTWKVLESPTSMNGGILMDRYPSNDLDSVFSFLQPGTAARMAAVRTGSRILCNFIFSVLTICKYAQKCAKNR